MENAKLKYKLIERLKGDTYAVIAYENFRFKKIERVGNLTECMEYIHEKRNNVSMKNSR